MNLEQFGQRMIELIPQLQRGSASYEHNHLSRGEITLPQLWVLEYLANHKNCPMNELATFLGVTRPAATGLIDRLIAQGLVSRESDKNDRRLVRISITTKGQRTISNIWQQKKNTVIKVFGQISPREREQYLQTLERVAQILGQQNPPSKKMSSLQPSMLSCSL